MPLSPLAVSFYTQSVQDIARQLLGTRLVRLDNGRRISGIIVETEAYDGESDLACHARAGRTARTEVMYGPPGRAYVYFIYGMHWMFNCVTGPEGTPAAVLVRALWPLEGLDLIAARRRKRPPDEWTNGPARLCQALDIDGRLNGVDLTQRGGPLWIETGEAVPAAQIITTARVGIDRVPEPWRSQPWRYLVDLQSWKPQPENNRV